MAREITESSRDEGVERSLVLKYLKEKKRMHACPCGQIHETTQRDKELSRHVTQDIEQNVR